MHKNGIYKQDELYIMAKEEFDPFKWRNVYPPLNLSYDPNQFAVKDDLEHLYKTCAEGTLLYDFTDAPQDEHYDMIQKDDDINLTRYATMSKVYRRYHHVGIFQVFAAVVVDDKLILEGPYEKIWGVADYVILPTKNIASIDVFDNVQMSNVKDPFTVMLFTENVAGASSRPEVLMRPRRIQKISYALWISGELAKKILTYYVDNPVFKAALLSQIL